MQKKIKQELLTKELECRVKVPVLFETFENGIAIGHSDNYVEYMLRSEEDLTGKMILVDPIAIDGETIIAK